MIVQAKLVVEPADVREIAGDPEIGEFPDRRAWVSGNRRDRHAPDQLEVARLLGADGARDVVRLARARAPITLVCHGKKKEGGEGGTPLTLAGGGRYDYLARQIGSKKDVSAVGISIGVDRIIASPWYKKLTPRIMKKTKIYFIQLGSEAKLKSLNIIEILRKAHIPITQSLSKDSLGSQLAIAEKLNIPYALIFGVKEALDNSVIVRDMSSRSQDTVKLDKLLEYLKEIK